MFLWLSSSPAPKRQRNSISASSQQADDFQATSQEHVVVPRTHKDEDVSVSRTRVSDDDSPASWPKSFVASSSSGMERSSKDRWMNPRVTVSPLRSTSIPQPSKKSDTSRPTAEGKSPKLPNKRRTSSISEKSKDEDTSPGTSARRRSRNIQLSSLFDSLSRFFSADTDRRRRTAYVNATVSLAQASFNSRQGFTSVQPPQPQGLEAPKPPQQTKPSPPKNTFVVWYFVRLILWML